MRLIKVDTLEFQNFTNERRTPRYGILSHRWQSKEVTYQDMLPGSPSNKVGYLKVKKFCKLCALDGLTHAWVDTCCIDKTSSAELSEAINSMYRWYQNATKCYVFLHDVVVPGEASQDSDQSPSSFASTEWFERGWTLQELIAPTHVVFYDRLWTTFGTKMSLAQDIFAITAIPTAVLLGESPREHSIAQRMSWAARRKTTRVEDQAYSLMGLFDVNMPMLYGEGEKAFGRLQEEIIKHSCDQSIFAWPGVLHGDEKTETHGLLYEHHGGLLATSPDAFAYCRNIQWRESTGIRQPYTMTNMGLSLEILLRPCAIDTYEALLDCFCVQHDETGKEQEICIYLRQTDQDGQYMREIVDGSLTQFWKHSDAEPRRVRVNVVNTQLTRPTPPCQNSLFFSSGAIFDDTCGPSLVRREGHGQENRATNTTTRLAGKHGVTSLLQVLGGRDGRQVVSLVFGLDFDFNPRLLFQCTDASEQLPKMSEMAKWLSGATCEAASWQPSLRQYMAVKLVTDPNQGQGAFMSHRKIGLLVYLPLLNTIIHMRKRSHLFDTCWTIDIQKAALGYDHMLALDDAFVADYLHRPTSRVEFFFNQEPEIVADEDSCTICGAFLEMPITTLCKHTLCQDCIRWADVSTITLELDPVPFEHVEVPHIKSRVHDTTHPQPLGCPICNTSTRIAVDLALQRDIQRRYPIRYAHSIYDTSTSADDRNLKSPTLETLTVMIGNTHWIIPDRSAISLPNPKSDQTPRPTRHEWKFFVRPSNVHMIDEVKMTLHKSFNNPDTSLRYPPFELRSSGWGFFAIPTEVILKPGYTFLHDDANIDMGRSCLKVYWLLDFDGNGSQGRFKVIVKRSKSLWGQEDQRLLAQYERVKALQAAAASV